MSVRTDSFRCAAYACNNGPSSSGIPKVRSRKELPKFSGVSRQFRNQFIVPPARIA